MADGTEMNVEAERADFEVWAELTDHQKHGANHEVIGWYYFEEVTQDRWEAWQASAARRAAQPADVGATELPPLPEPDGSSSVPIDESKFTFTEVDAWSKPLVLQYARDAIAADRRARANAPVPRWVDDQKGKDPLMDDMIGYIADLRAQLACQCHASVSVHMSNADAAKFIAEWDALPPAKHPPITAVAAPPLSSEPQADA